MLNVLIPLTPVTETNLPKGNSTEISFKLFLEQFFKIKLFFTDINLMLKDIKKSKEVI